MSINAKKSLENSRWSLDGRRSPVNLRRSNYLTNSELEYVVKKDMGTRVEPYGLVPAVSLRQRNKGIVSNNNRLDFLAKQLDLVTAELNESIGRVPHKKLRQILDKLNIVRSQMNLARYEEEKPIKDAIYDTYTPRKLFSGKGIATRTLAFDDSALGSTDATAVKNEMKKLIDFSDANEMSSLKRSDSLGDLTKQSSWYLKPQHRFSSIDDLLDQGDPLVNKYFPVTARFQEDQFSYGRARASSAKASYDPSRYSTEPPSVTNRYRENGTLTPTDIVDLAERSDYDPTAFEMQLLRLRAEKLQMEEEALLEMRRLAELERLRGPRRKWYELRNSNFWYEAAKNNQRLQLPVNDLAYSSYLDRYKESLAHASQAFERRWSSQRY